jgi:hypothetical protein
LAKAVAAVLRELIHPVLYLPNIRREHADVVM